MNTTQPARGAALRPGDPPGDRIQAIDALRGFALVGILFVNITSMGGPIRSEQPGGPPAFTNPDWCVWLFSHLFVYGTMRGLFSMLFGASALLFLRGPSRTPGLFAIRCFWLFWFGAINATLLLWPGDILVVYALAALAILAFLDASPRRLIMAALLMLLALSLWACWRAAGQPPGSGDAAGAAAALAAERAARLGDYGANLQFMWGVTLDWTLSPGFLWWIGDAAIFMLVGMALFRMGILSGAARTSVYGGLALWGMAIGLPVRVWEAMLAWNEGGAFPAITSLTFQIGRLAMTLGVIGMFMLAWRHVAWRAIFTPFAVLGRMALTGYLAQSVVAALLFSGFGLALWGRLTWLEMWALVPVVMAGMALAFAAWLRLFRMGPLEWAWRALTTGSAPRIGRT